MCTICIVAGNNSLPSSREDPNTVVLIYGGHLYCWWFRLISFTNFNAQFLYSLTICMLHYNPPCVSSINMPIFRRTNCIITPSGIVTLCKRLNSMPDESRLQNSLLSSGILYSRLQRVTIPDAVIIQFVLLKMGMLMFETRRGL